jgi:hypothetical protein
LQLPERILLLAQQQRRGKAPSAGLVVLAELTVEGEQDRNSPTFRVPKATLEVSRQPLMQAGDQAVLGAEMIEKPALADAGQAGNGIDREAPDASCADEILSRIEDAVAVDDAVGSGRAVMVGQPPVQQAYPER